ILAAKISGLFKSAFTNGAPSGSSITNFISVSKSTNTIVVIADVDLLADQFNFQELNVFGFVAHRPFNNNIDFILNGADQLCGDNNLISIRSRSKFDRPFTVVDQLERQAQQKWLNHEKELSAELQRVQQGLNSMQMKKDESQKFIISEEQQKKINEFRQKQIEIAKQLKQVRKNLRKDIDDLGLKLKFYNMALVPLLVCLFGIGIAVYRHYKVKNN
ncbi:MAG: ABC transporter, partial [Chlamydiae bacterium]